MERLKGGPVLWVDVADMKPCIGTGGVAAWSLRVRGKLFHSGIPQNAINPIELGMEALAAMQRRFYADFPPHPARGFCPPQPCRKPVRRRAARASPRGARVPHPAAAPAKTRSVRRSTASRPAAA